MNRVYKIEVEVTVEVPEGIEPEEDDWESMAASAVTQFHERDCSPAGHNVVWARISADVTDIEMIEGVTLADEYREAGAEVHELPEAALGDGEMAPQRSARELREREADHLAALDGEGGEDE